MLLKLHSSILLNLILKQYNHLLRCTQNKLSDENLRLQWCNPIKNL